MAEIKLKLDGYRCERCNHEWIARGKGKPTVCPKCKSPYWNVPKKEGATELDKTKGISALALAMMRD